MNNKKNAEKKDELQEITEQLQRLQAEFENYKKRTDKEQELVKDHAKAQLLLKLLNIHDDLEKAAQQDEAIKMIHRNFSKLLEEEQVRPIEAKGQKLDPYKHEVMIKEKGDEDDVITEELQKGWMHKDKVLRPSRVKISKKEE